MAKKRYINTKFWSDNFVVNLNPLDRYLFLYLLTNEHTDICGIYELPLKVMSRETGLEEEMLTTMLQRLNTRIYYIDGWVYIKNFAKHQAVNPKIEEGIKRSMEAIPRPIIAKISQIDIDYDRLSIESELPTPTPTPTPKNIFAQTSLSNSEFETNFETFWSEYPRKQSKKKAKIAFMKIKSEVYPQLFEALKKQKETWNEPQFIPHPTTWLNGARWEDEVIAKPITDQEYSQKLKAKYKPLSDQDYLSNLEKQYEQRIP